MHINRISRYLQSEPEPRLASVSHASESPFALLPAATGRAAAPACNDIYRLAWEQARRDVASKRQVQNRIARWL